MDLDRLADDGCPHWEECNMIACPVCDQELWPPACALCGYPCDHAEHVAYRTTAGGVHATHAFRCIWCDPTWWERLCRFARGIFGRQSCP